MSDVDDVRRPIFNPYVESSSIVLRFFTWGVGIAFIALCALVAWSIFVDNSVESSLNQRVLRLMSAAHLIAPPADYSAIVQKLGVSLPSENSDDVMSSLARLSKEPCDKLAIYKLTEAVGAQNPRWSGNALVGFGRRCGKLAEGDLRRAGQFFNQVGAYSDALRAEDAALRYDDANPDILYARAQALNGLARPDEAIADFRKAFAIVGSDKASESLTWDLVNAYRASGRFCDATQTLDGFIAHHPDYDLDKAKTIQADYRQKCDGVGALATLLPGSTGAEPLLDVASKAVAADNKPDDYRADLYTAEFLETRRQASKVNDPDAGYAGLTQEAEAFDTSLTAARIEGNRVVADIAAKRHEAGSPLAKTITFFFGPDGKIADVDTNATDAFGGLMPTLREQFRQTLQSGPSEPGSYAALKNALQGGYRFPFADSGLLTRLTSFDRSNPGNGDPFLAGEKGARKVVVERIALISRSKQSEVLEARLRFDRDEGSAEDWLIYRLELEDGSWRVADIGVPMKDHTNWMLQHLDALGIQKAPTKPNRRLAVDQRSNRVLTKHSGR